MHRNGVEVVSITMKADGDFKTDEVISPDHTMPTDPAREQIDSLLEKEPIRRDENNGEKYRWRQIIVKQQPKHHNTGKSIEPDYLLQQFWRTLTNACYWTI